MSGTYNHQWRRRVNEVVPVQRCGRALPGEDPGRHRRGGPREGRGACAEGPRHRPHGLKDARRLRAEPRPRRVHPLRGRAVTIAVSTWWVVGWAIALVVVVIAATLLVAIIALGR